VKIARYAAVVLAAGFSRRMGQFKSLLPLGNTTIADHLMATFQQNDVDVYLVAGYRQEQLRAGISTRNIKVVENPDYRRGMFSSIQVGISSLEDLYQATFIAPVDIPLVSTATIARLLQAAEMQPGKVIHPTYRGDRGHPPLIPNILFAAITGFIGNGNLKTVLGNHPDMAVNIEVPDANILFDIDEPADYLELLKRSDDSL
jgi:molybdenum cofactor cytidylyltransferase